MLEKGVLLGDIMYRIITLAITCVIFAFLSYYEYYMNTWELKYFYYARWRFSLRSYKPMKSLKD